jgi:hypothetical protein
MDLEPLSPEQRRRIESQFDSTVDRTRLVAGAFVRNLKRAGAVLVALLAIAWLVDYIELRRSATPVSTVEIKRYYAVGLKNGKTEMMYAGPESETCVNSVFPHMGHSPCWYVRRHALKQVDL